MQIGALFDVFRAVTGRADPGSPAARPGTPDSGTAFAEHVDGEDSSDRRRLPESRMPESRMPESGAAPTAKRSAEETPGAEAADPPTRAAPEPTASGDAEAGSPRGDDAVPPLSPPASSPLSTVAPRAASIHKGAAGGAAGGAADGVDGSGRKATRADALSPARPDDPRTGQPAAPPGAALAPEATGAPQSAQASDHGRSMSIGTGTLDARSLSAAPGSRGERPREGAMTGGSARAVSAPDDTATASRRETSPGSTASGSMARPIRSAGAEWTAPSPPVTETRGAAGAEPPAGTPAERSDRARAAHPPYGGAGASAMRVSFSVEPSDRSGRQAVESAVAAAAARVSSTVAARGDGTQSLPAGSVPALGRPEVAGSAMVPEQARPPAETDAPGAAGSEAPATGARARPEAVDPVARLSHGAAQMSARSVSPARSPTPDGQSGGRLAGSESLIGATLHQSTHAVASGPRDAARAQLDFQSTTASLAPAMPASRAGRNGTTGIRVHPGGPGGPIGETRSVATRGVRPAAGPGEAEGAPPGGASGQATSVATGASSAAQPAPAQAAAPAQAVPVQATAPLAAPAMIVTAETGAARPASSDASGRQGRDRERADDRAPIPATRNGTGTGRPAASGMATPTTAGAPQAALFGVDAQSGALVQPDASNLDGDTGGDRAGGEGRSGSSLSLVAAEAGASRGTGGSGPGAGAGAFSPGPAGPAQQVADAVRQGFARGSVDVALHPEELGRVRLSFSPAEAGLTITIQADRPETLDLLRRHADLLGNDLRQQGFGTISFEFGAQGGRDGRGADTRMPALSSAETAAAEGPVQNDPVSPAIPTLQTPLSGGLDLRL